jgi:hypothetical protein
MKRTLAHIVLAFLVVFVSAAQIACGQAIHQPFKPPVTAAKIRTAIDDAVTYLRSNQAADGSILEGRGGGYTALAALTLLAAGADPAGDDQLKKALDYLAKLEPNDTYVRGVRANVWEYALRKAPGDKRFTALLKADYDWLIKALGDKTGWRYVMESTDWDNSCTQYGVLGVWAAARGGIEPGDKFWEKMSKHFRGCQNADGGWGYTTGSGSTPNMATAGLASLFLVFDMHHGKSFYSRKNPRTFAEGDAAAVIKSLDRGMTWLGSIAGSKNDGYYLYGVERAGVASGRKYFGRDDWFAGGAMAVLSTQQADGSIPLGSWGHVPNTCFCTLFLIYGGAPVAFNKLEYGAKEGADAQDWNLNPRDLANVSKELWTAYERPLNWQTVSIAAEQKEIEAPILFISGSKAARFNEEEMVKLREYTLRGGTILAEASDHSEAFARSMEELCRQMYPPEDYPDYKLRPLPEGHGIYTVIPQVWKERPKLRGMSDGARTFFVLSEGYLSADWQMNRTESDAFKLATNLLFYATDLNSLEGKFASILPETEPAKPRKAVVEVARVRHSGDAEHPRDWDAANMCWRSYASYAKHVTGCELKETRPVTLGKDDLASARLLHITGQRALKLTAAEREALKRYVAGGGTVLVDAFVGADGFATPARRELEATFGKLAPLPADHVLAQGLFDGGVDITDRIAFKLPARQLLRRRGEDARSQKLLVAMVDKRPAVIFSEFDLSAALTGIESYQSVGYKPASARKIVGNVLAYVMAD